MDTNCRKDPPWIFLTELQHFLTGLQAYTWLDEITDIGSLHLLHQLRQFALFEGVSVLVI